MYRFWEEGSINSLICHHEQVCISESLSESKAVMLQLINHHARESHTER